jgi:general nucleoside transport system permease protein
VLYSESLYGRLKIFKEPELTDPPPTAKSAATL